MIGWSDCEYVVYDMHHVRTCINTFTCQDGIAVQDLISMVSLSTLRDRREDTWQNVRTLNVHCVH